MACVGRSSTAPRHDGREAVARPLARWAVVCALVQACGARTELRTPARDAADDAPVDSAPDVRPPTTCGNAVVELGEECDLGADNGLAPAFALVQEGMRDEDSPPIALPATAVAFYAYGSASSHTGFEIANVANVLLHADRTTGELALVMFAGRDAVAGQPSQPAGVVTATVRGLPPMVDVLLSDDVGELTLTAPGEATGRWVFSDNTDGGVLGALPWETPWTLTIDETFTMGIASWRGVRAGGPPVPLRAGLPALLVHRVTPSACRPDCRVPRCGDGYLDAGERCDDGNTIPDDLCSATCRFTGH
jgi:cysteine-rich repeat protein